MVSHFKTTWLLAHLRIQGNLALSRAIGDFEFKNNHALRPEQQVVTSEPDIEVHQLGDEEEFLILACDGGIHPGYLYARY